MGHRGRAAARGHGPPNGAAAISDKVRGGVAKSDSGWYEVLPGAFVLEGACKILHGMTLQLYKQLGVQVLALYSVWANDTTSRPHRLGYSARPLTDMGKLPRCQRLTMHTRVAKPSSDARFHLPAQWAAYSSPCLVACAFPRGQVGGIRDFCDRLGRDIH